MIILPIPQVIQELANKVRNATRGKDVREAIAKSMEKSGETSEESNQRSILTEERFEEQIKNMTLDDPSSAEIVDARLGYPLLRNKLQATDTQLAQTMSEVKKVEDKPFVTAKRKAVITIDSDDAMIGDYTVLLPLLNSKGVTATIAIPPGRIGPSTRMSWEQMRELVDVHGWSVASHTMNEVQLATVSPEVADYEMRESKRIIEEKGFKCDYLAYPNGSRNDTVMEIAKKYYRASGTTTVGVNNTPVMSQRLFRIALLHVSLTQIKAEIDKAIASNGWVIIYTHGDELEADTALRQKLLDVIDYAKTKGAEFKNHDEAWEDFGNVIDVGVYGSTSLKNNFVLSKNGDGIINDLKLEPNVVALSASENQLSDNPYLFASPITDYPLHKITYVQIDNNTRENFPENKAGLLMTNRVNQWNGYQFQEYHIIRENKIYRRFWDNGWSSFDLVQAKNIYRLSNPNAVTPESPVNDFETGTVTFTHIGANTGFPENKAGLLETNRMVGFDGYPFQLFHVSGASSIYKRFWNGSWSEWVRIAIGSAVIERTVACGSVNANEVKHISVTVDGIKNGDNLVCTPKWAIINNIMWSSQITADNTVVIRLFNPTSSAISVGDRVFKINTFK